ncbi:uncharacterized protein A4U43_C01F7440 [Asparagus officinalis]|uniref:F-box domain-containing protein n=1 Tax=Asparagus officinalis TaxID=4686 RepID=A0A5P1FN49_ASPOF|nr:F-box protein PP2-B11-like isoform X2 [Asparagus officinalis]ONK79542.1 uncharacterized protein A4U43_C01F7440 [Asparagus officinalis]
MSFQLERSSGAKCYMISARELSIVWGDTPHYWKWIPVAYTRFSEVAHLLNVCWLEIHGKIQTRILSPKTNYAAYLIYKLDAASHGLQVPAQETSVKLGTHESKHKVRLQPADSEQSIGGHGLFYRFFQGIVGVPRQEICEDLEENRIPGVRNDGWMEMEMGEFFNDGGDDGEVDMCLLEVKGRHWKSGLTVLGIEVRPKK